MRAFLSIAVAFCGVIAAAAHAQTYPEKAVRVIVPFAPGGNADTLARIVSERIGQALGQQFVIENRAGAAGVLGTEVAAKAAPDGYTLLFTASGHAINPSLYRNLSFDTLKDFAPISLVGSTPLVVAVTSALPARSVKELIALARAKPGALSYASAGNGSPGHLAGALLTSTAHVQMVHVPYKATTQAMIDLATGQVQVMYPSMTASLPQIKAGKIRAIAITSRERSALAPSLPTVQESGVPGYEASIWNGMLAPARTPAPIVTKLNATIVHVMQSRETKERLATLGIDPTTSTPAAFGRFIASEMAKWGKVIREAGVRND